MTNLTSFNDLVALSINHTGGSLELEETWGDLKEKWEVAQKAMAELLKGEKRYAL